MKSSTHIRFAAMIFVVCLFAALPALAQSNEETGKLSIHVSPKQAYVFVDGKAIRDGSQTIELAAGTHEVGVDNYGYIPNTQKVHIGAGETTRLNVTLEAFGDMVAGPFGDIEFKGHPRAAVLLNGTTPAYFVGHVDEFDWDWIWHQRLLVHPGTYQVMVTREGNTIWSGPITVNAGQKVIVNLNENGVMQTKDWPEGNNMPPQPRFHAGIASATVPVAPVTARLSAQSRDLNCGQSTDLNWKAGNAVAVSITNLGTVPASGDHSVTPLKTTQYELIAKGPGGEATQTATVNVIDQPTATLSLSQPEAHYRKVGDKVVEDDTVTLSWSTTNANKVNIAPLGDEPTSGNRTIEVSPKQTSPGEIHETDGYTLTASNVCGKQATDTALLHINGSIEPAPAVTLASVFYPTNYPRPSHPKVGLVASEQRSLSQAADEFLDHEKYDNDNATLMIVGHADVRGSNVHNLKLSERRTDSVRAYLVSKGIPADKIETRAEGKREQLSEAQVANLQKENPQKPERWMMNQSRVTWLAYNRRVDIILEPEGEHSAQAYPNDSAHARLLWQKPEPSLKAVESAAAPAGSLHAGLAQN